MPLSGRAKTDYQRWYMRKYRSNTRSNARPESVRPKTSNVRPKTVRPVRPEGISDNQWAYIQMKAEAGALPEVPKTPKGAGGD